MSCSEPSCVVADTRPRRTSIILEDPDNHNLVDDDTQRSRSSTVSVERREWDAIVMQTPCSSFSVVQEPGNTHTMSEPEGMARAMTHWRAYLARGNKHARFTAAGCPPAASKVGTLWMVENPPTHSTGPAYWPTSPSTSGSSRLSLTSFVFSFL